MFWLYVQFDVQRGLGLCVYAARKLELRVVKAHQIALVVSVVLLPRLLLGVELA